MSEDKKKDETVVGTADVFMEDDTPTVVFSPEVQKQMDEDPVLAEAMRDLSALFRQAMTGVKSGQYDSMEDAMESLTGERPVPVDFDDLDDEED